MSTTCIRRPRSSPYSYLCQTETVKPSIELGERAPVPKGLVLPGVGAPHMCPECVVAHVAAAPLPGRREVKLCVLLDVVRTACGTTRQGAQTVARYTQAIREAA